MPAALKRKRQEKDIHPAKKVQGTPRVIEEDVQIDDVPPVVDTMQEDSEIGSENGSDEAGEGEELSEGAPKHSSKLPSAGELRAINEARNLFKSNTFKAQLDLLLQNIRPKASHVPPLERTLQRLHTLFMSLPSVPPVHPLEAVDTLSTFYSKKKPQSVPLLPRVAIPYPLPPPAASTAWKVAFEHPEAMNVMGSWPDGLAVRKPDGVSFGVDVVVEMPASLFQEKDYRNSRVFYKRAFYLACLATSIVHSSLNLDAEYEAAEGDVLRTTLLLLPRKDGTEHDFSKLHAVIRIIPVLPDNAPIPLYRLSPAQSNLRGVPTLTSSKNKNADPDQKQSEPETDAHQPTPRYNNTLALSFARTSRTRLVGAHTLLGAAPGFGEGLALLRVWANQRGYAAGARVDGVPASGGGLGAGQVDKGKGKSIERDMGRHSIHGFEGLGPWWACVLEVLLMGEEPPQDEEGAGGKGKAGKWKNKIGRPLVGKGLSSYQLFRAALDFLATRDFEREPVYMKVVQQGCKFPRTAWAAHHTALFIDATGTVNMLANVHPCALQLLRHDAACTLRLLNASGAEDVFAAAFLQDRREAHGRFDSVLRLDLTDSATPLLPLLTTVHKALTTRARAIALLHSRSAPRALDTPHPYPEPHRRLRLGVVWDARQAGRVVDHGPAVSSEDKDKEAEAFRAFWGVKAELRRFRDGRIEECCVWGEDYAGEGEGNQGQGESIPARIVRYILARHYGVGVLEEGGERSVVGVNVGSHGRNMKGRGEGGYAAALRAFDTLWRELRAAAQDGDVPLSLVAARPCAAALRYMAVVPPTPVVCAAVSYMSHNRDRSNPTKNTNLNLHNSKHASHAGSSHISNNSSLNYTSKNSNSSLPPHPSTSYLPAFDVTLHVERSPHWPDDLQALRRVKLALYERLAGGLREKNKGWGVGVVTGTEGSLDPNPGSVGGYDSAVEEDGALEVVLDGWAFRVWVGVEREGVLLRDAVAGRGVNAKIGSNAGANAKSNTVATTPGLSRTAAMRALQTYTRRFTHAPAHHTAMLALHHRLPALAPTVRLVKRWLGAHWLSGRVREEAVELVCVAVFLGGGGVPAEGEDGAGEEEGKDVGFGVDVSASGKRGFVRVVRFLSSWDGAAWVGLYETVRGGEADGGDMGKGMGKMEAGKGRWRLATLEDAAGTVWCEDVSVPVAMRVRDVARATLACLEEGPPTLRPLFEHPRGDYDFLIELDPLAVSRYWENLHADSHVWEPTGYMNLNGGTVTTVEPVRVGFNPGELFVRDLQRVYGDTVELFYDVYGGTTVGGVWNPRVVGEGHAWRVFLGFSSIPVAQSKDGTGVIFNVESVLAEMGRMGAGIVRRIVRNE